MQRNRAVIFATLAFLPLLSVSSVWANPLFGPKTYTRERGGPEAFKGSFQVCALSGVYTLIVENSVYTKTERDGEEEGKEKYKKDKNTEEKHKKKERREKENKVSAAEIEINGKKIIEEDDFNNKLTRIERTILLHQGENKMEVEVEGDPGAFITVNIECASGCIEPRITDPNAGDTLNQSTTLIRGNLSHVYGEVGVTINGVLAQVNGLEFAAVGAPLNIGENTLTATATDACGTAASNSITVSTVTWEQSMVQLMTVPTAGIIPLSARFEVNTTVPFPITNYQWDFEGDGVVDTSGPNLSQQDHTFSKEGLYFPRVILTDNQGNQHEDTGIISVLSFLHMNALLTGKWDNMRAALTNKNIEKALVQLTEGARSKYQRLFEQFGDHLRSIAIDLPDLQFIRTDGDVAVYYVLKVENGREKAHFVYFVRDASGLWKLQSF